MDVTIVPCLPGVGVILRRFQIVEKPSILQTGNEGVKGLVL
jgi:hypothetical protein